MSNLLTRHPAALQLLMTDDLYPLTANTTTAENTIEQVTENKAAEQPATEHFIYLGENNKYFLILINEDTHKFLNPVDLEMMLKIMQLKGYELRDIAVLNLHNYPKAGFAGLKRFFACSRIVFFGASPQQTGIQFLTANQPQTVEEVKILATYSFEEMRNDKEKKRRFWNVMQSF